MHRAQSLACPQPLFGDAFHIWSSPGIVVPSLDCSGYPPLALFNRWVWLVCFREELLYPPPWSPSAFSHHTHKWLVSRLISSSIYFHTEKVASLSCRLRLIFTPGFWSHPFLPRAPSQSSWCPLQPHLCSASFPSAMNHDQDFLILKK